MPIDATALVEHLERVSERLSRLEDASHVFDAGVNRRNFKLHDDFEQLHSFIASLRKAIIYLRQDIRYARQALHLLTAHTQSVVSSEELSLLQDRVKDWTPELFLSRKLLSEKY